MAARRAPRRDPSLELLAGLRELGEDSTPETALARLRSALRSRQALVVAKAAARAAALGLGVLAPDLARAFDWLLEDDSRDPGASAKLALIKALTELGSDDSTPFLRGVRHVQLEPVWGGRIDVAGPLRGTALQGLVAMGHRDALFEAPPLLVDARVEARRLAVEALGMLRADEAELLLRLKVEAGDEEPLVLADALAALMAVNPERSLGFVAERLSATDAELRRGAALALGESRHPDACSVLHRAFDAARLTEDRALLLLPMALTRTEAAFTLLLGLVLPPADSSATGEVERGGNPELAEEAVRALRLFRGDETRRAAIEHALVRSRNPRLCAAFEDRG